MKELLGIIAVALSLIGHAIYVSDTYRRKTKPHIFSWIIWSGELVIVFAGQMVKGGGAGAWSTGATAFMSFAIAILAFNRGTKDITKPDKILFLGALSALFLWYFTQDPTLSIVLLAIVDLFAFIPTIRKTAKDPKSETFLTYGLNLVRHPISIIALTSYNLATVLYPAYLFVVNLIMTSIIASSKFKRLFKI